MKILRADERQRLTLILYDLQSAKVKEIDSPGTRAKWKNNLLEQFVLVKKIYCDKRPRCKLWKTGPFFLFFFFLTYLKHLENDLSRFN